jgi:hypothetical protein
LFCKNCREKLVKTNKDEVLHLNLINIGTEKEPFFYEGAVLMSKTTNCYYPERDDTK